MDTAAIGVTEKEDEEQRIHEQDVFDRVVFFLAAITVGLFSRVLGADDAPFRPVMGKRGESDAATTGAGSSASEPTMETASASATPPCGLETRPQRAGSAAGTRRVSGS